MLIRLAKLSINVENDVHQAIKDKLISELGNYLGPDEPGVDPDIIIMKKIERGVTNENVLKDYIIGSEFVNGGSISFSFNFKDNDNPMKIFVDDRANVREIWKIIENIMKITALYRYDQIFIHGSGFIYDNKPFFIVGNRQCGKTKVLLEAAKRNSSFMNEDFIIMDKMKIYSYFPQKIELAEHHFRQVGRSDFNDRLKRYYGVTARRRLKNWLKMIAKYVLNGHDTPIRYVPIDCRDFFPNVRIRTEPVGVKDAIFAYMNPINGANNQYEKLKMDNDDLTIHSFWASYIEMTAIFNIIAYVSSVQKNQLLLKIVDDYRKTFFRVLSNVGSTYKLVYPENFDSPALFETVISDA